MVASMSSIYFLNCAYFHLEIFILVHFKTVHRQVLTRTPTYSNKLHFLGGFLEAVGVCQLKSVSSFSRC